MTNPVRKLLPRSLDPRQNVGEPVFEADTLVEDAPGADDEDRSTTAVLMPDGTFVPSFKAFKPRNGAPPVSADFKADPGYVAHVDFHHDTKSRAITNYNSWQQHHSDQWHPVANWLIANDCAGDGVKTAREELAQVVEVADTAAKRLAEARTRADQAEVALSDAVRQAVDGGRLPAGEAVLTARREVEAAQLVADTAAALKPAAQRASQRALGSINWRATLVEAEKLSGPEAAAAVAWVRAELDAGPGPLVDPLRWL